MSAARDGVGGEDDGADEPAESEERGGGKDCEDAPDGGKVSAGWEAEEACLDWFP